MQVTEDILRGLQVQWLVIPSVKSLVGMWTNKFGFLGLTQAESEALEDRIVTPDTTSATMLKKKIHRYCIRSTDPPMLDLSSQRCHNMLSIGL